MRNAEKMLEIGAAGTTRKMFEQKKPAPTPAPGTPGNGLK